MTLLMQLSLWFAPHESDFAQPALETLFALLPRIAGASLLAYLVSQTHDIWAYGFWKKRFGTHVKLVFDAFLTGTMPNWTRANVFDSLESILKRFYLVAFAKMLYLHKTSVGFYFGAL